MLQSHMQIPLSSNQIFWTKSFSTVLDTLPDIFCRVCHLFFSIFDEHWTMINFPPCLTLSNIFLFIFPLCLSLCIFSFFHIECTMCHQHLAQCVINVSLVFNCCYFCYHWMKVLICQKNKNLLLGTNSLVLSYTQIVVEVWRGLTELD